MNIGLFTELFPPSIGGQQQRFADLAELLAMRGHKVTVMCIRHTSDAPAEQVLPSGVEVFRRPLLPRYYKPLKGMLPRSPLGIIRYAMAVRQFTRARDFDALFLNQWPLLHVVALSRRDRARAIIDWCEIRDGTVFRAVQRVLPRLAMANTAVSTQVAQQVRPQSVGRVMVLPSGIWNNLYRMAPSQDREGILYLGRITGHKNLPLLIDTFEELCRRGCGQSLTIAGAGPAIDLVRRRIEASPWKTAIRLLGAVTDEQKIGLLAGAKVLVITSQREGFPRVVAEAMASGLPTVTARYPRNGTSGIVEEFDCGLCAEPTSEDLADAVEAVLGDWETWSARSHCLSASLEWSSLVQQFEVLLNETAAISRRPILERDTPGASCESW